MHGKVLLKKQLERDRMVSVFASLSPCLIGMATCGSAYD